MRDSAERRKRTCSWPDKPMSSRMGWPRLLRACLLFVIERAKLIGWKQIPSERHLPMLLQECRDEPEEEMQSWAMGICGVSAELAYIDGAQRTRMTHSMFFFNHGIASRSEQPCLGLLVYWLKKRGRPSLVRAWDDCLNGLHKEMIKKQKRQIRGQIMTVQLLGLNPI